MNLWYEEEPGKKREGEVQRVKENLWIWATDGSHVSIARLRLEHALHGGLVSQITQFNHNAGILQRLLRHLYVLVEEIEKKSRAKC